MLIPRLLACCCYFVVAVAPRTLGLGVPYGHVGQGLVPLYCPFRRSLTARLLFRAGTQQVSSDVHSVRPRHRALLLIQERASEVIRIPKILKQTRLPPEMRNVDLARVSVGELQL